MTCGRGGVTVTEEVCVILYDTRANSSTTSLRHEQANIQTDTFLRTLTWTLTERRLMVRTTTLPFLPTTRPTTRRTRMLVPPLRSLTRVGAALPSLGKLRSTTKQFACAATRQEAAYLGKLQRQPLHNSRQKEPYATPTQRATRGHTATRQRP